MLLALLGYYRKTHRTAIMQTKIAMIGMYGTLLFSVYITIAIAYNRNL